MKKIVYTFKLHLIAPALLILGTIIWSHQSPAQTSAVGNAFALQAPAMVRSASAAGSSGIRMVESEAGISYYVDGNRTINLNLVRNLFRTIEDETGTYIIGSVPVDNYGDNEDVHVYVDTSGWILAYYPFTSPTGRIFDWIAIHNNGGQGVNTKLENALNKVASAVGVSVINASYYDFRQPDATHMSFITEGSGGTDSFELTIPSSFTYYDVGWSAGGYDAGCCGGTTTRFTLNGSDLWNVSPFKWAWGHGSLPLTQLTPDVQHTFTVIDGNDVTYGGVVLLYAE